MNFHQINLRIIHKEHLRIILNPLLDFYKLHKVCLKIIKFFLILLTHKIKNRCTLFLIVLNLRLVNLKTIKINSWNMLFFVLMISNQKFKNLFGKGLRINYLMSCHWLGLKLNFIQNTPNFLIMLHLDLLISFIYKKIIIKEIKLNL